MAANAPTPAVQSILHAISRLSALAASGKDVNDEELVRLHEVIARLEDPAVSELATGAAAILPLETSGGASSAMETEPAPSAPRPEAKKQGKTSLEEFFREEPVARGIWSFLGPGTGVNAHRTRECHPIEAASRCCENMVKERLYYFSEDEIAKEVITRWQEYYALPQHFLLSRSATQEAAPAALSLALPDLTDPRWCLEYRMAVLQAQLNGSDPVLNWKRLMAELPAELNLMRHELAVLDLPDPDRVRLERRMAELQAAQNLMRHEMA